MRIKAKLKGSTAEIKLMAKHPMDTGRVKNPLTGELIPANYIKTIRCHINGEKMFQGNFGTGVSKNPFLKFTLLNRSVGEILIFDWEDLSGLTKLTEVTL